MRPDVPPHGAQSAPWGPRQSGATSAERGPHRACCARWVQYRESLNEEQRSQTRGPQRGSRVGVEEGCSAGRMQLDFHHGLLNQSVTSGHHAGIAMTRSVDYDRVAPAYDTRYERNRYDGVQAVLQRFIGE